MCVRAHEAAMNIIKTAKLNVQNVVIGSGWSLNRF